MIRFWVLFLALTAGAAIAGPVDLPIERQVGAAVKSPGVTVVHLWAPWCASCITELANHGWSTFIAAHPDVNFIFVTVWNDKVGREVLEKNGVGGQKNFTLLLHPNPSQRREDQMKEFLGVPVTWVPTTWVFKAGKLRYALNYGELHFPMLQQLIQDSSQTWDR